MLIRPILSSDFAKPLLLWNKRSLQPIGPSSSTRHGWFRLPPIDQYSSLLPPVGVWTVLSSNVGDLPLRTPKDRRHGEPLPHHPANPTHAHLIPNRSFLYKKMSSYNITGYYAPFPVSIPQYKAGCIRVTHPSAGRRHQVLLPNTLPLDLHVLCLPLAFILSQDQTLHCINFSLHNGQLLLLLFSFDKDFFYMCRILFFLLHLSPL